MAGRMHESNLPRQPAPESSQSFDDLGLTPELRVAVAELGWERPTPIQALVIPPALAGRDLIGQIGRAHV